MDEKSITTEPKRGPGNSKSAKDKTKKRAQKTEAPPQIKTGVAIKQRSGRENAPAQQFTYVLGPQEKALHDYLRCVFNPRDYSARVPNSAGGFELYTQLWRTFESGSIIAGSNGVGNLGLCCNGWIESANYDGVPDPNCQVLGWSSTGVGVWKSASGATAYTVLPTIAGATAASGYSGTVLDPPTDKQMNSTTRIRLVAVELRVRSTLNANTAKGEVMIAGSVNPMGGVQGGSLNDNSFADITKTNEEVVTRAIRSVSNWPSDEVLSIVAIPAEQQAFEMVQIPSAPTAGAATFPVFTLGVFARDMNPGDALAYEVCYVWETEMAKTNSASINADKPVMVPPSTLALAASNASKYATTSQMPGIHSLPYIETLGTVQPNAVEALSRHPDMPLALRPARPSSSQALVVRPAGESAPGKSFLGKLWDTGKSLLKGAANSGILMRIPEFGPIIQGAATALSTLFDR